MRRTSEAQKCEARARRAVYGCFLLWSLLAAAIPHPRALQKRWSPVCVHTKDVPWVSQHPRMNIMPDVVDAQLRLRFLGRDVMLPSVMASDPAHDESMDPTRNHDALPVEALKKHV